MVVEVPAFTYVLTVWILFWKAIGLWKSARKGHLIWFVLIMFLYTFGILPAIYVIHSWIKDGTFKKSKKTSTSKTKVSKKKVARSRKPAKKSSKKKTKKKK